jgi:proline dehydrogenase
LLLDRALVRLLPAVPRPVVQLFSSRYIAGSTLEDAVAVVRRLNAGGMLATIDVLGEETAHADDARAIARTYLDVFDAIEREHLDANVSVKLTALGLELSYELCMENVLQVLAQGRFVRIDMEDSTTTDATYLRRTLEDVRALADLKPDVRLCKGIYVEPPSLAYTDAGSVRASFVQCLDALLEAGSHVAVATHDERLIGEALKRDVPELQMLLGVREDRARELVAEGHRLRVYVPFGEQWYAYSLRRLQENPAMATTIARAAVGRALRF